MSIQPILRRTLNTNATAVAQTISRPKPRRIPPPNDVKTPADFLKAIGRSSETKLAIESWNEFWNSSGLTLKGMGVSAPQDRKYILWCMERYRQGFKIEDFAHDPRPQKKIRGRGPSVQNGKKVRR